MSTEQVTVEVRLEELERARSRDVVARLAEARALEGPAARLGEDVLRRVRLVVADTLHRTGDVSGALRIALEVLSWAEHHDRWWLRARAHLVLSSLFEGVGDLSASLNHAIGAVEALADSAQPRDRAVHLLRLADALALNTSVEEARPRYAEAESLFAALGEEGMRLTALNNLTVLECEAGEVAAAAAAAERLARSSQGGMNADYADTIARARLLAGDPEGAQEMVALGLQLWQEQGDSQLTTPAELLLTHARALLALGEVAAAERRLEDCLRVCAERELRGVRLLALEVRAEAFAARGDFESAYLTHRAFHDESERRRSQRLEAAARARHAALQTDEARQQARQFWEQARQDPLTGLYNRRFVDERLPWVLDLPQPGVVVVAAVVDVDHFKQINDRFSHDVGDEVLRILAGLMSDAVAAVADPPSRHGADFVARLGGEEFLIVLTRVEATRAVEDLEALRVRIERRDWDGPAPGFRVTVSMGVAVAAPTDSQRSLLARADRCLYIAKRTGRNRIEVDRGSGAQ